MRNQKSVSLNLATRLAERESDEQADLDRENERRTAMGLEPFASIEELGAGETPAQILLDQATRLVAEMASIDFEPGQTP